MSGTATAAMADHESGATIDGAKLTEMDCRWSPTMGPIGQKQENFEETQPHSKFQERATY
jgi:hypothetical protein